MALLLLGPFMMYAAAFLATGEPTVNRWVLGVAGLAVTVSCVKLTRYESRLDGRARQDQRRLEAVGRPATAEITAVRSTSLGEEDEVELSLLISGARFVLLHMIEETARHGGHANIIRESLDGTRQS